MRSLGPDRCRSAFPICPLTVRTAAAGNGGDGGVGAADGSLSVGGAAAESTSRVLPGWEHFHFAAPGHSLSLIITV